MQVVYYTGKSLTHEKNQDGLFLQGYDFTDMDAPQFMQLPSANGLFAVLDGMGGAAGGAYATRLLLNMLASIHIPAKADCATIRSICHNAAKELWNKAIEHPELTGMGASMAGIWLRKNEGWIFNSGDCRVYKYHCGKVRCLSHDHSLVQDMVDQGILDEDSARIHPRRNVLLSAITAIASPPEVRCTNTVIFRGERFLICSDGVWSLLEASKLERMLSQPLERLGDSLLSMVHSCHAPDDFSYIVIQC